MLTQSKFYYFQNISIITESPFVVRSEQDGNQSSREAVCNKWCCHYYPWTGSELLWSSCEDSLCYCLCR